MPAWGIGRGNSHERDQSNFDDFNAGKSRPLRHPERGGRPATPTGFPAWATSDPGSDGCSGGYGGAPDRVHKTPMPHPHPHGPVQGPSGGIAGFQGWDDDDSFDRPPQGHRQGAPAGAVHRRAEEAVANYLPGGVGAQSEAVDGDDDQPTPGGQVKIGWRD